MATTTTVYPSKDSYINEASPTTNYGGGSYVKIGYSSSTFKNGLYEFDLTSVTNPTDIVEANLKLTIVREWGSSIESLTIARLAKDFTSSGCTWQTRNGAAAWTTAGAVDDVAVNEPTYSISVGNGAGDQTVDIKDMVIDAINRRDGVLRFMVYFVIAPAALAVANYESIDAGIGLDAPQLVIKHAERMVWEGGVSGDLSTANNWEGKTVPTADDVVIFTSGESVTSGSLTCNKLYINEGFFNDFATTGSGNSLEVTANEIRINKKRGVFNLDCQSEPIVYVENTSSVAGESRIEGTYTTIINSTRAELELDGTGGEVVIAAAQTSAKANSTFEKDATVVGGTLTIEGGSQDVYLAQGAKLRSEGGDIGEVFISGSSDFRHKGGTLSGGVTIYSGTLSMADNDSAQIESEDVIIYKGGTLDARTQASTYTPNAGLDCRGGNFLLDVGYTVEIN